MTSRASIAVGMAAGTAWALALLGAATLVDSGIAIAPALACAFLPTGIVLMALVARLAMLRFADDALINGQPFVPGSPAARLQAILRNSVEQALIAACVWPFIALASGPDGSDIVLALGLGLGVTRIAFWVGYAASPPLRAFGFAGGFYPTVLAVIWAVFSLFN